VEAKTNHKFPITLEEDEDGFIVAECPVLPGCVSQGKTREEALANIEEAIRGYIASLRKHGQPIPSAELTEVEVIA
jgi:predicted RNase H-like HicB family nuclease